MLFQSRPAQPRISRKPATTIVMSSQGSLYQMAWQGANEGGAVDQLRAGREVTVEPGCRPTSQLQHAQDQRELDAPGRDVRLRPEE